MLADTGEVQLLRRLFFRRFFDNDLIAPNGGGDRNIGIVYAVVAVPGLLGAAPLLWKYMNPIMTPGRRLLIALDDKLLCLSISMIVMGIATLVAWDTLGLDGRDVAALGPLPVTRRMLLVAKLEALGLFVATFAVAVNAIPSLLYPAILLGTLQISLVRAAWLIVVHAVVSLAAGAFGFFAVLACREVLSVVSSAQAFRRLSVLVQSALLLVFVTAFLLVPARSSVSESLASGGGTLPSLSPPAWFLGVYESLTGRVVLDAPGVVAPVGRLQIIPGGAAEDRRTYLGHAAEFERLAATAAGGLGVAIFLALGGYAIETRRLARRVGQARPILPRWLTRSAFDLAEASCVRDPLARATFFFTIQTCVRGATQRLYLAAGAAVTLAALIVFVPVNDLVGLLHPPVEPTQALLTVQLLAACAAVATLRFVCAVPVDLRANWIFQVTWARQPAPCFAGVRRAVFLMAAIPLVALLPVHVLVWGPPLATVHVLFGALAAAAVVEWSFLDLHALPFTCAGASGRSNSLASKTVFTAAAAWPLGWLEHWGIQTPDRAGMAVGALGLALVGLAIMRARRLRGRLAVVFEEPADLPTQRLGLSADV
jgi:hypothetical protein